MEWNIGNYSGRSVSGSSTETQSFRFLRLLHSALASGRASKYIKLLSSIHAFGHRKTDNSPFSLISFSFDANELNIHATHEFCFV
jgi:hypothetical protein